MDFTGRRMRTRGRMSTGKESHIASVCKSDSEAAWGFCLEGIIRDWRSEFELWREVEKMKNQKK